MQGSICKLTLPERKHIRFDGITARPTHIYHLTLLRRFPFCSFFHYSKVSTHNKGKKKVFFPSRFFSCVQRTLQSHVRRMRPPMDPSLTRQPESTPVEEDEWDTEGFIIPSLAVGDSELGNPDVPLVEDTKPPSKIIKEENIYLGPHGGPRSQPKQQDLNPSAHKQRFKNKLKEADRKFSGSGRENRVETIHELVGGKAGGGTIQKSSTHDWLDPHCHESQFERYSR